jgi:hypothetical protein
VPMVRGVPEHECMLELPKRKRQKHLPTTPTAQNAKENATSRQYKGSTEECVPCGTSEGNVEALNRSSQAANSTSSNLHKTSQSSVINSGYC